MTFCLRMLAVRGSSWLVAQFKLVLAESAPIGTLAFLYRASSCNGSLFDLTHRVFESSTIENTLSFRIRPTPLSIDSGIVMTPGLRTQFSESASKNRKPCSSVSVRVDWLHLCEGLRVEFLWFNCRVKGKAKPTSAGQCGNESLRAPKEFPGAIVEFPSALG